VEFVDVEV